MKEIASISSFSESASMSLRCGMTNSIMPMKQPLSCSGLQRNTYSNFLASERMDHLLKWALWSTLTRSLSVRDISTCKTLKALQIELVWNNPAHGKDLNVLSLDGVKAQLKMEFDDSWPMWQSIGCQSVFCHLWDSPVNYSKVSTQWSLTTHLWRDCVQAVDWLSLSGTNTAAGHVRRHKW